MNVHLLGLLALRVQQPSCSVDLFSPTPVRQKMTFHVLHQEPSLQESDFMFLSTAAEGFIMLLCFDDFRTANRVFFS